MMQTRNSLPLTVIAMVMIGALAAGCTTGGSGSQIEDTLGTASPSDRDSQIAGINEEVLDPRAYCPKTVMRAGTETFDIYPANMKKDDPEKSSKLRFRGTITDLVRECNYVGPSLNMKVGIAGRGISGPSGETGSFLMPVRIAVTQGDNVLYSQLHDVPVEITPGRPNVRFSFVDSQISIPKPEHENIIVYVGYDEQRVDKPDAQAPRRRLQPVN